MNRKGFAGLVVLLGIFVLAMVVGGTYYFGVLNSQREVTNPNHGMGLVLTTPSPNLTANWKTYTNKQYQYTIMFPPEWKEPKAGLGPSLVELTATDKSQITISAVKTDGKSLTEYLQYEEKIRNDIFPAGYPPALERLNSHEVGVDGQKGIELDERFTDQESRFAATRLTATYVIFQNLVYIIRTSPKNDSGAEKTEAVEKYHQILSTFKFYPKIEGAMPCIIGSGEEDNGKKYSCGAGVRFILGFDKAQYPVDQWQCDPAIVKVLSKLSFDNLDRYVIRFEAVQPGRCVLRNLKNNNFSVTIEVF